MGFQKAVRRRFIVAATGVFTVALAVSGCSVKVEKSASTADARVAPQPELRSFYSQQLAWQDCDTGQCAHLEVPVDYRNPDGNTIKIAVNRRLATGESKRVLVVNPGGPGGSGVDYANAAEAIVSPEVFQSYDIVGFDPRGVARSAPIKCVDDAELDNILGANPFPANDKERAQTQQDAKEFAQDCKENGGELLAHVSTRDVARDMDVLRAALGQDRLDFLGKSYGTFLGATYAELFPSKVGRFVLDGVLAPDLPLQGVDIGQARGFQRAAEAYLQNCVKKGNCPLGETPEAAQERLIEFLRGLKTNPLPVSGDARVKELTSGWGTLAVAMPMYSTSYWPVLTSALRSAIDDKDGTKLMALANAYADRNSEGKYSGNIMQVINAVTCLDRPSSSNLADYQARVPEFQKVSPIWGDMMAYSGVICGQWPYKGEVPPHKITAAGAPPILVIGTTRDPATPFEWAQTLAEDLENGRLVAYDGDGHTAYTSSNSCVDAVVDDFLLQGKVPQGTTNC